MGTHRITHFVKAIRRRVRCAVRRKLSTVHSIVCCVRACSIAAIHTSAPVCLLTHIVGDVKVGVILDNRKTSRIFNNCLCFRGTPATRTFRRRAIHGLNGLRLCSYLHTGGSLTT